jgi:hypothetical protein
VSRGRRGRSARAARPARAQRPGSERTAAAGEDGLQVALAVLAHGVAHRPGLEGGRWEPRVHAQDSDHRVDIPLEAPGVRHTVGQRPSGGRRLGRASASATSSQSRKSRSSPARKRSVASSQAAIASDDGRGGHGVTAGSLMSVLYRLVRVRAPAGPLAGAAPSPPSAIHDAGPGRPSSAGRPSGRPCGRSGRPVPARRRYRSVCC